ncbi:MAG: aminopeptidase N C-terminal domain-containing protein, partial [Pseudomonadota bacterium]
WEAGRALARDGLMAMLREGAAPDEKYIDAVHSMARDDTLDPAFRALALGLPSEDELAQAMFDSGQTPDPSAIRHALDALRQARAEIMQDTARALYAAHQVTAPYSPDADQAGARSLANVALSILNRVDGGLQARAQFDTADNMTQQLAAFGCLLQAGQGDAATKAFYDQWHHDRLVVDKWFMMQVANAEPHDAATTAQALTDHPDFTIRNPNRFRAVMGALVMNPAGFHDPSGQGYRLLTDWLMKLDPLNPQTTARMCSAFEAWRRYDSDRQALIGAELDRILSLDGLSRDTREMVSRIRDG